MTEAAASCIATGADKLESYIKKRFERRDLVADNKTKLRDLLDMYSNTLEDIREAENSQLHTIGLLNMHLNRRLGEYKKRLGVQLQELQSYTAKVEDANWMSRVKRMRGLLDDCEALVKEVRDYYEESVRPALEQTGDADGESEGNVNGGAMRKGTVNVEPNVRDRYVPCSNVPPNPPRLTLDYSSPTTYEGKLRAEILKHTEGSTRIIGVMALGLGGVGKTCALRGLANDTGIREMFPGGILFIQLGNDSNRSDIIRGIADCVYKTGGTRLSKKLKGLRTVEEACDEAQRWFENYKVLFLVDDIWEVNKITPHELRNLGGMLNYGSLLVFTSRSKRFIEGVDRYILFKEREAHGELARCMLMNHANIGSYEVLSSVNRESVEGILEICQGLPLALGIAGATVRSYSGSSLINKNAWCEYFDDLKRQEEDIIAGRSDLYGPLTLIVDKSLKVLDGDHRLEKTFKEMFQGFCVFQKQQTVSGHVLRRLWNLDDLQNTRKIVAEFDRVSLIRMHRKRGNEFTVQIHDLVLDIANKMTSRNTKIELFDNLLNNYFVKKSSMCPGTEICAANSQRDTFRAWWEVDDDGFIHDNLCRILLGTGETKELVWLLESARWITTRLRNSGIRGVEQDVAIGLQTATGKGSEQTELVEYLRLIESAARMSFFQVAENPDEAWFQMYGRLIWYAEQCRRTRWFTQEIEQSASRPFVKPCVGVLKDAGGPISEGLRIQNSLDILAMCHEGDVVKILWMAPGFVGFVSEYERSFGKMRTYKLNTAVIGELKSSRGHRNSGLWRNRDAFIVGGAFVVNLKKLVTAHYGGTVVVWDMANGYKVDHSLKFQGPCIRRLFRWAGVQYGGHNIDVQDRASVSGDGRTVVFRTESGQIYVWDLRNQHRMGSTTHRIKETGQVKRVDVNFSGERIAYASERAKRHGWICEVWDRKTGSNMTKPPEMQNISVTCVAVCRDGGRLVSGSFDGSIRIWNMERVKASVQTIFGHTEEVTAVAFSPNGDKVISAALDMTVRVWDAENGVMNGEPVHIQERVEAIAVSADGKEAVLLVSEDTVCVLNTEKLGRFNHAQRYSGEVRCVSYGGDGKKLVTGCEDGCVRLWDAGSGFLIGQPLEGHTKAVTHIALSADGNLVVSASWDQTLRVWDANSRHVVAERLLSGHICDVAVNKDGTRVVYAFKFSSVRGEVDVWHMHSDVITKITRDAYPDTCVAISVDGERVAFASRHGRSIVAWDVHAQQQITSPLNCTHKHEITSLAFSADGTRLVSASVDNTVCVWDMASGHAMGEPFQHSRLPVRVQADEHGGHIVSYDSNGYGELWHVERRECIITSSHPDWTAVLHRFGLDSFNCEFGRTEVRQIIGRNEAGHEQVLATTEKRMVRVGDLYFSEAHGPKFWPFCSICR